MSRYWPHETCARGNCRVIDIAQTPTPERFKRAEDIAAWFGVPLEVKDTGAAGLEGRLEANGRRVI